jgi:7-cyano-7-deazaguanine synthase
MSKEAIILLSGGQDSTTILCKELENGWTLYPLGFDYGQKHKREIDQARKIITFLQSKYPQRLKNLRIQKVEFPKSSNYSDLLFDNELDGKPHKLNPDLPASFVPGRNMLFLMYAAMIGYSLFINDIFIGVNQEDYSGYPDCREQFIQSMENTLKIAFGHIKKQITIHTPLLYLNKSTISKFVQTVPYCREAIALSHTCYNNQFPPCGNCPACKIRAKGFEEAGIIDPIMEGE